MTFIPRAARVAGAASVGLALATSLNVVAPTAAQAAASCSGAITYSKTINTSGGSPIGELTIYYNSSNGGTNSACFYHRGAAYGVAAATGVRIWRCAESSGEGQSACTVTASSTADNGNYRYYAGPRAVTGTANVCVWASGHVTWKGVLYPVVSNRRGC